jgi:hypothetical protein
MSFEEGSEVAYLEVVSQKAGTSSKEVVEACKKPQ